jgi:hypothetical protein
MPDRQTWDQSAFDTAYDTSQSGGDLALPVDFGIDNGGYESIPNEIDTSGWAGFDNYVDSVTAGYNNSFSEQNWGESEKTSLIQDTRSMADQARGDSSDSVGFGGLLDKLYKSSLGSDNKNVAGFSWRALEGLGKAYLGRESGESSKMSAKAAMMNAQTNASTQANKVAQQGSAGVAWQNVKKPGLLSFQPLQINDISKRIA